MDRSPTSLPQDTEHSSNTKAGNPKDYEGSSKWTIRRHGHSEQHRTIVQKGRDVINEVLRFVTQARASQVLGISKEELQRISSESGLGRVERAGDEEETYFTYEELQRVWVLAAYQKQIGTLSTEVWQQG